jgi:signal transduction histidine kinase
LRIGEAGGSASLGRAIFRRPHLARPADAAAGKGVYLRSVQLFVRRYGDAALAAVVAVVYVAEVSFEADVHRREPAALVALAFAASLLARRRYPLVPLLAGLAVIELDNTAVKGLAEAGIFLVAFIVALYSAGRWARGPMLVACVLVTLAAIPLAAIEPGQPVGFGDVAFFVVFFAAPIVAGRLFRYRAERERVLVDEHETRTAEAIADERARIARELHDVVAHAISVMVLQARGGRRMLPEDPDETRTALDAIERSGEQALGEMRRLLGMLRAADERAALRPQPGLGRLDELAAEVAAAGLSVEVSVEGEVVELPPGVDVSAYRIVQEALTNALKHAGPARATVAVRYGADALELEVVDDGSGNGDMGGSGHGLVGIRERVGVYGGDLEAGARSGGGYRVRARLPFASR